MDLQAQIDHLNLPGGARITTHAEAGGRVYRVTQGECGLDILLTDEAVRMYGEGPTLALVLGRLRDAAVAGLPPTRAPGEYERQVFVGD